jgi:plastocyanin
MVRSMCRRLRWTAGITNQEVSVFDRSRLRPLLVLLAVMLVTALVVAGCGGDDDDDDGGATTTEQVTTAASTGGATTEAAGPTVLDIPVADSGFAFAVTEITAPAGEITLRTVNPQSVEHNIALDAPVPTVGDTVSDGGVSEITVTLEPGTYEYYCAVPGHRQAGMVGTLTVE